MRQGAFAQAIETSDELIKTHPKNIEAIYFKAVSARYSKQYELAQATLQSLRKIAPEFGRGLQEEGHLARDQGLFDAALQAYQKAVRANPALIASWRELGKIFDRKGNFQEASHVKAQAERLSKLPPELVAVTNLIHEQKSPQGRRALPVFFAKTSAPY